MQLQHVILLARAPGPSRVQGIARCKDVPSSGVEFDSLHKFIIEKRKTLEDVQSHPTLHGIRRKVNDAG